MPVPTHFRFTVRGEFTGTPEEWSFGMHFSRDSDGAPDAHLSDVDEGAVTTAVTAFFAGGESRIGTNCKVTDWRMYEIDTTNHMVGDPLIHIMTGTPVTGGSSPKYPPQVACVITTVGPDRGPARFGRFYLPTAATIAADARVSIVDATAIVEASSTFMKDVSNAIDMEFPASSSGLNISQIGGAGAKQIIDHLECGRVLDTLRNRRKSLLEEKVTTGHIDW